MEPELAPAIPVKLFNLVTVVVPVVIEIPTATASVLLLVVAYIIYSVCENLRSYYMLPY